MTQTVNQVPMACGDLFVSLDCLVWTEISGESQSVSGTEQARQSGEQYTLEGDTALVCGGKRVPMELTFVIVYTEDAAEAYEIVRALFETAGCGTQMCVRWTPAGSGPGAAVITTPMGVLTSFTYPTMDASAGGCILGGFNLKVPYVTTVFTAT